MIASVRTDWTGVAHWQAPFGAGVPRKEAKLPNQQTYEQSIRLKDLAWS